MPHCSMPRQPTLWTIGHSTRPIDEFTNFLRLHEIRLLVDVRTIPRSRYNPQFNTDMLTEEFQRALEELMAYGTDMKTAIMCAEAVPWRCHRSLIADALVSKGWEVRHIISAEKATPHVLTSFAHFEKRTVTYPKPTDSPSLF